MDTQAKHRVCHVGSSCSEATRSPTCGGTSSSNCPPPSPIRRQKGGIWDSCPAAACAFKRHRCWLRWRVLLNGTARADGALAENLVFLNGTSAGALLDKDELSVAVAHQKTLTLCLDLNSRKTENNKNKQRHASARSWQQSPNDTNEGSPLLMPRTQRHHGRRKK